MATESGHISSSTHGRILSQRVLHRIGSDGNVQSEFTRGAKRGLLFSSFTAKGSAVRIPIDPAEFLKASGVSMSQNPKPPVPRPHALRPSKLVSIGFATFLLAVSAICIRFEVFASASAPPSPEWRDDGAPFLDAIPLENAPVIVATVKHAGAATVTVRNQGTTILTYSSAGRSGIQLFREFEEWGKWAPAGWDWCGTGKEDFELAPGDQVELAVDFWDIRRERMLACFTDETTNQSGLIVLAAEGRRLTLDVGRAILPLSSVFAAFCIWLTVRIVNGRKGVRFCGASWIP
jgi:hypothetical protein